MSPNPSCSNHPDAALRVYAESGEQGLTVSAITKASGVSLGSLYHHFGSINGLTDGLMNRRPGRMLGELVMAVWIQLHVESGELAPAVRHRRREGIGRESDGLHSLPATTGVCMTMRRHA